MPADVIERITALEREQRALCDEAAAAAKQRLTAARRTLERKLEDDHHISEAEAHRMLVEAEAEASQETERVLDAARGGCEELRQAARERLEEAAQFIVERVVDESWRS